MHGKTGRFWGGRFYSTIIESETQFFNTLTYIELNMVRARGVEGPQDWKWSSYHAHAFGQEDKILDVHPLYLELGKDSFERKEHYRAMVYGEMQEKGLLRKLALTRGIVLGSEAFVSSIRNLFKSKHPFYAKRRVVSYHHEGYCLNRPRLNPLLRA